jgi:hypothetical protein
MICSGKNNESTTRASRNSTMVGKGKVMSHEDIVQAQRKREKKDADGDEWRYISSRYQR